MFFLKKILLFPRLLLLLLRLGFQRAPKEQRCPAWGQDILGLCHTGHGPRVPSSDAGATGSPQQQTQALNFHPGHRQEQEAEIWVPGAGRGSALP